MSLLPYELTLVAAYMGRQRIIGNQGDLPWPRIETDTALFRAITLNSIVIMGRVTWEAIIRRNGHPLRGRTSIVLSRGDIEDQGCIPAFSIEDVFRVIEDCREEEQKVFVIGGAQIHQAFLPYTTRMLISRLVHWRGMLFPGDTYFPCFNKQEFKVVRRRSSGWERGCRVVLEERRRSMSV